MAAIQNVKPYTNITLPRDNPCNKDVLKAFYDAKLLITYNFLAKILSKTDSLPKDLTVLMLQTESLIIDPTAFYDF